MLKNHKIQMFVTAMLIVATFMITLSAARPGALMNEEVLIPITGNEAGLAQYHLSEWGPVGNASRNKNASSTSNPEGLAQYYLSERGTAVQNGLAIYHQSERMQAVNWNNSDDPLYKYHQSEWFGK